MTNVRMGRKGLSGCVPLSQEWFARGVLFCLLLPSCDTVGSLESEVASVKTFPLGFPFPKKAFPLGFHALVSLWCFFGFPSSLECHQGGPNWLTRASAGQGIAALAAARGAGIQAGMIGDTRRWRDGLGHVGDKERDEGVRNHCRDVGFIVGIQGVPYHLLV